MPRDGALHSGLDSGPAYSNHQLNHLSQTAEGPPDEDNLLIEVLSSRWFQIVSSKQEKKN